jgi:glutamyl/glutaminyl-tRNA synthetase
MTNTPRQILLLQALGLNVPRYAHVALLLGMDGAPLSKRHGALSVQDLRKRGYLPNAIRNHLVRLGHTVVTDGWLEDAAMTAEFDLGRLGRAAAKFDDTQLLHWQKEGVAHMSLPAFEHWIDGQVPPTVDAERRLQFAAAVRHNVEFPTDAKYWAQVVFGRLSDVAPEAMTAIREAGDSFFAAAHDALARAGVEFKQAAKALGQATGRKGPALYMPLRAALTGVTHGPELAPLLPLIPVDEIAARLARARALAT